MTVAIKKKLKSRVGIFKNMGGNIPGGKFLGGNFPGRSLMGGNFPGGSFPDTILNKWGIFSKHFFAAILLVKV